MAMRLRCWNAAVAAAVGALGACADPERTTEVADPRGTAPTAVVVSYDVTLERSADACALHVHLSAQGLSAADGPLRLVLDDWGGWTGQKTPHITGLAAVPPVHQVDGSVTQWTIEAPASWDGRLDVTYLVSVALDGTASEREHGILPWSDTKVCVAYSNNTLAEIHGAKGPIAGTRRITITPPTPPGGQSVATGWAGTSAGRQVVERAGPINKCPIVLGVPAAQAAVERGGIQLEAVQFGAGSDLCGTVLGIAGAVEPAYARNLGRAPVGTVRIMLVEGVSGGTHSDHGCVVGYNPQEDPEHPSAWFKHFLAHELFHGWLGADAFLRGNESITWFHEGFTDYLSLWHLASTGQVTPEWMAERLLALEDEARRSPAVGKVAFATEGGWRDADGARETLAYKGGAILALAMDVELRKQGRPGVIEMIADLAGTVHGEVSLADVRGWMQAHGLGEFYERYVAAPELPSGRAALAEVGFVVSEAPTELTYLGLRVVDGPNIGRIAEIDPEGPCAALDVKVGDSVTGYFPSRSQRPRVGPDVQTRFTFGLDRMEPGVPGAYIGVVREKREIQVFLTPRLVPGGFRETMSVDEVRVREFLSYARPG